MSPDALLHLWRQYQETGDQRLRDRLILSLAPIVKSIVYRKVREVPSHREVDDFLSCGLEALIRSIDRYDPDRGATLELGSLNAPAMSDDDTQIERLDTVASRDREFDPEFAAMREGAIARLREAFDELPERERKVALLLHVGRREVSFGKPG